MQKIEELDIWRDERMAHLTHRERDVMSYLLRGAANKVIAAELGISQRTVENHRAKLFRKMQVRNIVGLVRMVCVPTDSSHGLAESAEAHQYLTKSPIALESQSMEFRHAESRNS